MRVLLLLTLLMGISSISKAQGNKYEYLPIIKGHKQPIVAGTINGKKAYFLLDTGSALTILHRGHAKFFKFDHVNHVGKKQKIYGFDGSVQDLQNVYNAEIMLGGCKVVYPLVCYNMYQIVDVIKSKTGIAISGIIGADIMRMYSFLIDLHADEVIVIGRSAKKPEGKSIASQLEQIHLNEKIN